MRGVVSYDAATFARSLPWRRVIDPEPVKEFWPDGTPVIDTRDLLECGHTVSHPMMKPAKKRRCFWCGMEARS
jgi:hypothetical protein